MDASVVADNSEIYPNSNTNRSKRSNSRMMLLERINDDLDKRKVFIKNELLFHHIIENEK